MSDSPPAPISIAMVAESLRYALIKDAKIKGPFTTVGYDLGGLFTRVFTAKNVDIVDSMMLVESWHEELLLKTTFKDYYLQAVVMATMATMAMVMMGMAATMIRLGYLRDRKA